MYYLDVIRQQDDLTVTFGPGEHPGKMLWCPEGYTALSVNWQLPYDDLDSDGTLELTSNLFVTESTRREHEGRSGWYVVVYNAGPNIAHNIGLWVVCGALKSE